MPKLFRYSKSIFQSRIVWVQILTAATEVLQVLPMLLPVPPGTATAIGSIATIILRRLTDEPVHVVTPR
jgi:nitrate reductase gamma subunit